MYTVEVLKVLFVNPHGKQLVDLFFELVNRLLIELIKACNLSIYLSILCEHLLIIAVKHTPLRNPP